MEWRHFVTYLSNDPRISAIINKIPWLSLTKLILGLSRSVGTLSLLVVGGHFDIVLQASGRDATPDMW